MARYEKEYYIKNLSVAKAIREEESIKQITINENSRAMIAQAPQYLSDGKVCMQDHNGFKIFYPMQYIFQWPRDIWLPNPEAEGYMCQELKQSPEGILGYYDERMFMLMIGDGCELPCKTIKSFIAKVSTVKLRVGEGLIIR